MEDRIKYRGYTISRQSRRWRWDVRVAGERLVRSFHSLDGAKRGLDDLLDRRDRQRTRERSARTGRTVQDLVQAWFAEKDLELARSTSHLYDHHVRSNIIPGIGTSTPRRCSRATCAPGTAS